MSFQLEGHSSVESTRVEIKVKVVNTQGLHARPAAQFVKLAGQYDETEVTVVRDGMNVNGKSIMGMKSSFASCS